jgi:hypothetical protein
MGISNSKQKKEQKPSSRIRPSDALSLLLDTILFRPCVTCVNYPTVIRGSEADVRRRRSNSRPTQLHLHTSVCRTSFASTNAKLNSAYSLVSD